MRLHRLRMTALGPYATEQMIDFDRLAQGGLFLLEGPTGAGKSTVLDAITFALYGGLAGEDSADDRLRSHFAAPDARTEAELEWSLRGVRYRVTRSPEYRRPKKRGDGMTIEPAHVHFQRRDGTAWVSVSANKAEAGEVISELLGLTRTQFTQVMLLPQGEFARFLRSSDDDRRRLLTKLFGTSLYDRITDGLCRLRTEATRTREAADRAICDAVSAAAEAAGLDAAGRAELLAAARDDRHTRLKELDETLAGAIAATGAALEAAAGALGAAQAEDEEARRQAGLMTRLTTALTELQAHAATQPDHDLQAARLAAARAKAAEAGAAGLQHDVDDEQGLPERAAELDLLEQDAVGAEERVAALELARQDLPDRIITLQTRLAESGTTAAGLDAAAQHLESVHRRMSAAARLAELEPRLADLDRARQAAIETHHRLVDEHQRLLDTRLSGIAAELAAGLAEGRPCRVCGSPAHPEPALACGQTVSAEEVEEARARREAADAQRAEAESEHTVVAVEAAGCAAVAEGGTVGDLAAEAEALAGRVAQAQAATQDVIRLETELADTRAEAEHMGLELREAAEVAAAARAKASQAAAELAALTERLRDAAQGHTSVAARQAALRHDAARERALAAALDSVAACLAAQAAARDRVDTQSRARGFATPDEAASAVLSSQEQATLAAGLRSWEERLDRLTAAVDAPDLAGLDPAQADRTAARAEQAAAAAACAQETEREARKASQGAAGRSERFAQRTGDVRAVEDDYDRVAEETEAVIHLAGLASGTEGQRRVALTTYVLRHWFAQVVAAANLRLSAMSSQRYELRRTDEGRAKRDRSGLTLAVIDRHTGEERSPASLSGGETFYTSLALALGLADVVREQAGGVDLDTLFIDEGFGSLDADTLDQVMGVIDDLRDRGRVIGIVSHVAELKERVPERLEVRRLPDGSSAVRVVA